MAKGKVWRYKDIEEMTIHAFLTALSFRIERQQLKAHLRKTAGKKEIVI